ncbi:MAG: aminotransferase class I/II-fold pyridoxal phosphate-dependent enzyme [Anaerolineales bacterium]|nr:aminotransferase class I/II-fold pyridoxal phosphate-dependent enzyme [Anaerolineales bacterium]
MKKNFHPFELERIMSIWEHQVEYNLSESGVQPMSTAELLGHDPDLIEKFLSTGLNYPQTNGSIELRDRIAALYPGAARDNVVVTTGAAQANFTTILTALDPGDEIVIMLPNYMQIWGLAKNYSLDVKTFSLNEEIGWGFDTEELQTVVSNKTRLIAICNPNNPTGHIMTADERAAVVSAADRVGAWLLTDEVYAGAEHHTDQTTLSLWVDYERVLAVGSLSKAFALPGLRIGWVVAPADMAEEIWARQDYITISATVLGNQLAAHALSPQVLPKLIDRTRAYVRKGYQNFESWCQGHPELITLVPPEAAAIAFVRYHKNINSSQLIDRLIREQSAYVVPGDHFGLDHHLRISYGLSDEYVNEGLSRLLQVLQSVD